MDSLSDSGIKHLWPCSCLCVRLISSDQIRWIQPMRTGGDATLSVSSVRETISSFTWRGHFFTFSLSLSILSNQILPRTLSSNHLSSGKLKSALPKPPSTLHPILLQLFIQWLGSTSQNQPPATYERHYLHVDWCRQSRLTFNISNTVAMTSKTAGERRWKNEIEWWHSCTTSLVGFWLTFFIYFF